jgi:PAS domain S-box-containing protein
MARVVVPYGGAFLAVALAALLRAALAPVLGTHYPLATFYVAVALVGWFWGVKPAVLAALLGYPLGEALFLSPSVLQPHFHLLELCVYAAICTGLIAFVYRVFDRQRQLDQALRAHELAQQAIAAKGVEEQRAREMFAFSERRYRTVSEAFDFGMWSADAGGRLTFASPRLLKFLGLTFEQSQQRLWPAVLASESDRETSLWQTCTATGQAWDWESSLTGAEGSIRRIWSRGIPLRRPDGTIDSWAGFCLDVTERYAAERARDQARQHLEVLTERMSVGVAHCNRQLEYVWANPAYAQQIGHTVEQMAGRRITDVLGSETFETLRPYFQRVLAGEYVQYERAESISGMPKRWIQVAYTPIWNGEAEPIGWVAVLNDLTERRELEEQLRAASVQKDRFLATLAHELRNPLAPIRYATRLLKPGVPADMVADAGAMIDRQLAHMARLLDDLLDVSRITRGTLEIRQDTLDLRATLQQAVDTARPLAEAAEHRLELEAPDTPLLVRGDETRLIQVMGNLINNALKYTSPGGQIRVSARISDGSAVISVRDNGSGIAPELLPQVFELFFQGEREARAQTGLGIGLALARQIVELHGGSIEAHSDGPGHGSEFRLRLPIIAETAAVDPTHRERLNVAVLGAARLRVLIVDDNADAAEALAQVLQIAGYQTHVAFDGRTALEMAEILKPSVVLLDLGLPHLSGREVGQRLRATPWGRAAHLIAITGWGGADEVLRSRESGFDQHLTKPVDPDVLLQLLICLTQGAAGKTA